MQPQAAITCECHGWAVIGLRIDSTRRIQVLFLDNNLRDIGVIDSILALEDIERPEGVEHYDFLLSKLKREVVMEEGDFTWKGCQMEITGRTPLAYSCTSDNYFESNQYAVAYIDIGGKKNPPK